MPSSIYLIELPLLITLSAGWARSVSPLNPQRTEGIKRGKHRKKQKKKKKRANACKASNIVCKLGRENSKILPSHPPPTSRPPFIVILDIFIYIYTYPPINRWEGGGVLLRPPFLPPTLSTNL